MTENETAEEPALVPEDAAPPGVLVVWSGHAPAWEPRALFRPITIGRSREANLTLAADTLVSRLHAEVRAAGGGYEVRDLGSSHGTFVNGTKIAGATTVDAGAVVRVGRTLLMLGPLPERPIEVANGYVISAHQHGLRARVREAARVGVGLLVLGPTGAGKEMLAREYHAASPRASGPFVAHAAPNLDPNTADAALFGTRRGGFTGAIDREGLLVQANGGTLFLDEIGDLSLEVQAKLLRALQEREIAAVGGAGKTRKVDFQLCAATSLDLDRALAEARFRRDFLERIRGVTLTVRSLDERRDEIPTFLATRPELTRDGHKLNAQFVEACMIRSWPGNVRELRNALTAAIVEARARATSKGEAPIGLELHPHHLPSSGARPSVPASSSDEQERALIVAALRRAHANGTSPWQEAGMPKSTFYDKVRKHGIQTR